MATPIWKDLYVTLSGTSADYQIRAGNTPGTIIYTGKAIARPGATDIKVRINEICANYIRSVAPRFGRDFSSSLYTRSFYVDRLGGSSPTPVGGEREFLWNWSYDPNWTTLKGYAFPIDAVVDPRQLLPVPTNGSANTMQATIVTNIGVTIYHTVTVIKPADYQGLADDPVRLFCTAPVLGTAVVDIPAVMSDEGETKPFRSITLNGIRYAVEQTMCHRYVAYYLNSYGGFDSFLFKGACNVSDTYERAITETDYDNGVAMSAGRFVRRTGVTRVHTFNTGWLSDTGAERLAQLTGSPLVYIHDLVSDSIFQVIITDTTYTTRTHAQERGSLNATITAEEAIIIERR